MTQPGICEAPGARTSSHRSRVRNISKSGHIALVDLEQESHLLLLLLR